MSDRSSTSVAPPDGSPEPPLSFESYSDYTDYVRDQVALKADSGLKRDLWLAQMPVNDQQLQWYRLVNSSQNMSARPESSNTNENAYESIHSTATFQDKLKIPKQSVAWQILLVTVDFIFDKPWRMHSTYHDSMEWFINIAGLALNVPLSVWEHLRDRFTGLDANDLRRGLPVLSECPSVLEIGMNSVVVINATDEVLPPTVLVLVAFDERNYVFDSINKRYGPPQPFATPDWVQEPFNTPNEILSNQSTLLRIAKDTFESRRHRFIRTVITKAHSRTCAFSLTDGLFASFIALLELKLGQQSPNIPVLGYVRDLKEKTTLKYYRWSEKYLDSPLYKPESSIQLSTRLLWMQLRDELDMYKMMFEHVTTFTQKYFRNLRNDQEDTLNAVMDRFKLRLKHLELMEANLKDRISMYSSQKSTEMAERSIQESKRVILLTALAFIFLPVSLASSIYGMNVKEINETGHSITAFAITAVALCITTLMTWGAIAKFASFRNRVRKEWSTKAGIPDSAIELLIVRGPRPLWWQIVYDFKYGTKSLRAKRLIGFVRSLYQYFRGMKYRVSRMRRSESPSASPSASEA